MDSESIRELRLIGLGELGRKTVQWICRTSHWPTNNVFLPEEDGEQEEPFRAFCGACSVCIAVVGVEPNTLSHTLQWLRRIFENGLRPLILVRLSLWTEGELPLWESIRQAAPSALLLSNDDVLGGMSADADADEELETLQCSAFAANVQAVATALAAARIGKVASREEATAADGGTADRQQEFEFGEQDLGIFSKDRPTLFQGQNLDIPTFQRRGYRLKSSQLRRAAGTSNSR
jgi:hypothetical protein